MADVEVKGEKKEKMDEFLRKKMMEEADRYEEELNADPALAGIEPSPDLFARIMKQVAEESAASEDGTAAAGAAAAAAATVAEDTTAASDEGASVSGVAADRLIKEHIPVEELLSESDRRALELGRRAMKRKPYRKVLRSVGIAAAVMMGIFGVSMVSEANRVRVLDAWNMVVGQEANFKISNSENAYLSSLQEREAREEIYKMTEIIVPEFMYCPQGIEYDSYKIESDDEAAKIYFKYEDTYTTLYMIKRELNIDFGEVIDGQILDRKYIKTAFGDIEVLTVQAPGELHYVAEFVYNNCYYRIYSVLPEEEFTKMIKNILFSETAS